jgi:DNA-binding FadR family transcriptional regulator
MVIQAVTTQRLYQQVAEQITHLIQTGAFPIGSKLPPERDLATQFGISRPTVREALISLEIAGLVDVRTGSGATVIQRPAAAEDKRSSGLADAGPSPFELIATRKLIEPPVAGLAAQLRTAAGLARLSSVLVLFENEKAEHYEKLEADRQFHMGIAAFTKNTMLIDIMEQLWRGMFGPIFAVLSARTRLTDKRVMTYDDHQAIFRCIEAGDSQGAYAAMLMHLLHVESTLMQIEDAVIETKGRRSTRRQ